MTWLGITALVGTAIHYAVLLYRGWPWDLVRACHLAGVLVGVGCVADWPPLVAVGVLWLLIGLPLWVVGIATGDEFLPTSSFTHVGALVVGLIYLADRGMPRGVWWQALIAVAILQRVTPFVTPHEQNVNLASSVYKGWENWFPTYFRYWLFLTACFAVGCIAGDVGLSHLIGTTDEHR
jgi:hypothetical protein